MAAAARTPLPAAHPGPRGPHWPLPAVALGLALADLVFLHHVWRSFANWGIWDWDLQESLLEAARVAIVRYGELPLWNPYRNGGFTLVGNPLGRAFNPSFLPVLLFGTVPGVKIAIGLYLWIAQLGMLGLCRALGTGLAPALLAALLFTWGGCFTQHLTHGHYEWLGYAWLPFALLALLRAEREGLRRWLDAAVALALLFLDGGPYQEAFSAIFVGAFACARAAACRRAAPLVGAAAAGALALLLAAVQIAPVAETVREHPRPTPEKLAYFGLATPPGAADVLRQGLLGRDQTHAPNDAAPFRINVGAYVGVLPLLLAAAALLLAPRQSAWLGALLVASLWLMLSEELPVSPWALLHALPGFSSLQVPARFNLFVLLLLALLAAQGLARLAVRAPWVAPAALVLVAADLFWVDAPVYRAAFAVPPIPLERRAERVQYQRSPYTEVYAQRVTVPVRPAWPSAAFPATLENAGVVDTYLDLLHPRAAIPFDAPGYPGAEVFVVRGASEVRAFELTPNHVRAVVEGGGGRIAVNQNFHRGWKVLAPPGARLGVHRGLLAVDVPAGRHELQLAFAPGSFRIGAALSALAWCAVLALRWRTARGGPV
jgi:hypothetical protein